MTYNTGTATDYLDMLSQLVQVLTSRHLESIALTAGGTGYEVSEVLNIDNTGATFTHQAQIEVLTVDGGGAILTARVYRGGAYTVDPTDVTAAATTSTNTLVGGAAVASANGTGATFDFTFGDTGWTVRRRTKKAVSAVVVNGGTGYTNGATVTLSAVGSVKGFAGQDAQFTITAAGGIVSAVAVVPATDGNYEEPPTNPNSPSGGAGTGLTLTVTYADDTTSDQVLVLEGEGTGGTEEILVALRTFNELDVSGLNTVRNWQLFAMLGYNPGLPLHQQAFVSPGFELDGSIDATTGAFMVLKPSTAFPIVWRIQATARRFCLYAKVEDASFAYYPSMHLGHLNPFGTSSERPYPIFVCGATSRRNSWYLDANIARMSGLTDVFGVTGRIGPAFAYLLNAWREFKNATCSDGGSPTRTGQSNFIVWPIGRPNRAAALADDQVVAHPQTNLGLGLDTILPDDGIPPGDQQALFYPTENSGDDLRILLPATVMATETSPFIVELVGEMEGVFWLTRDGLPTLNSEATFLGQDGHRYTVLQNGNRTATTSYLALREN